MAEVKGNENQALSAPSIIVRDVNEVVAETKAEAEKVKEVITGTVTKVEKDTKTLLQEAEAEYEKVKTEVESISGKVEYVLYEEFEELRDAVVRLIKRITDFNISSPHKI